MKKTIISLSAILIAILSYSQEYSMIHDGLTRTYRLHTPAGYDGDSLYPLVINMHGLGSNATEEELYTGFNYVADSEGFFVTYPNAIDGTWNITSTTGTDDVGFISALIDTIDLQYNIDLDRVFATGLSMGGFMSYRLACELSERIAAIGPVAGLQASYPCNPGRPVPVVHFHGTADEIVPYAGVPTTISNWVSHNACPETPVVTDLPDIDTNDNSTVTVSYYGPCEDSTEVTLYTINNGEHTWPGAAIIIGVTNKYIQASVEIWNFFKKYNIHGSTGIKINNDDQEISYQFYPNPVKDLAIVELAAASDELFDFRMFDLTGKLMQEQKNLRGSRFLIDCSQIPAGIYITELTRLRSLSYQKIIVW
jgi:polyhydroxybutyrate depolymerase